MEEDTRIYHLRMCREYSLYGAILMRRPPKKKELTLFYFILESMVFHFGDKLAT